MKHYSSKEVVGLYTSIKREAFNIDVEFVNYLSILIAVESGFDAVAKSSAGAIGLTQVTPIALREINNTVELLTTKEDNYSKLFVASCSSIKLDNLIEVGYNIRAGSCYLELMRKRYDSYLLALMAYNGGGLQVSRLVRGKPVVNETANYIIKVLYLKEKYCDR